MVRAYCRAIDPPCYTLKPVPAAFYSVDWCSGFGASSRLFRGKQLRNVLEGDLFLIATSGRVIALA